MHAKPRCNGGAAPVGDTLTEGRGADGEFQLIRQNAEGLVDVNQIVVGQLRKHLVRFANPMSSSSASSVQSKGLLRPLRPSSSTSPFQPAP